jgi:hypothetical protein
MDDLLVAKMALAIAGIYFAGCVVLALFRWSSREFWRQRQQALENHSFREHRAEDVRREQLDKALAQHGREIIESLPIPSFRTAQELFAQLRGIHTALDHYSRVCFFSLKHAVNAYQEFSNAYQLADQDECRKQTQVQVISIAAAGLQILGETTNGIIVDPIISAWKLNLERIRHEICPRCPVVDRPYSFQHSCPVMQMLRERDDIQKK